MPGKQLNLCTQEKNSTNNVSLPRHFVTLPPAKIKGMVQKCEVVRDKPTSSAEMHGAPVQGSDPK